ncbi:GNAT family N-acetyltransferase [Roseateles oligotrophus]|uniref:GNAT family N-acetyltransferase n=1 Tax=Roseateles oligotrophus TaxID=1769250 RepID=A0ABT2Y8U8_9BURK|nr:GNAT family N-acetyltransferase [Roseateles oligotrophus]MCV2366717.1 GNAT family N-acetyltransferase [Roseateles oligotrophus]
MQITIRRAQVSDAAAFADMMSHPEVFAGLLQNPHPSEEQWRQRLQDGSAPGKTDLNLVALNEAGRLLGSAGLHPAGAALRRRHVASLGVSVAQFAQGQGVGTALLAALMDYADNWGQILRTELTVYADNARAIKLYQRMGFEQEGRMKAYALRAGVYVDTLAMARLHPKPPSWS